MEYKNLQTAASSLFVNTIAIICWFVLAIGAGVLGYNWAAAFLIFMFLLAICARLWAFASLNKVSVELKGSANGMFCGEETELSYTVHNTKLLPLVWLDVLQELPSSRCLMPLDNEGVEEVKSVDGRDKNELLDRMNRELYQLKAQDDAPITYNSFFRLRRRFSFILWHQSLSWRTVWQAKKRGVYQIKNITLISGDALGLAQKELHCPLHNIPTFAVYPKLQAVNSEPFMRTLWSSRSGSNGFMEDPTVIRSDRDYIYGDSWKRINWRTAARRGDLQVNIYDTVLPKSTHFLLDGESFRQQDSEENEALEDSISVLASLLVELSAAGVDCALSLPKSRNFAAMDLKSRNSDTLDDMLFALAGYEYYEPDIIGGEVRIANPPSVFNNELFSNNSGRSFYFCYDAARVADWSFIKEEQSVPLTVISYLNADYAELSAMLGVPIISIDNVKRG